MIKHGPYWVIMKEPEPGIDDTDPYLPLFLPDPDKGKHSVVWNNELSADKPPRIYKGIGACRSALSHYRRNKGVDADLRLVVRKVNILVQLLPDESNKE